MKFYLTVHWSLEGHHHPIWCREKAVFFNPLYHALKAEQLFQTINGNHSLATVITILPFFLLLRAQITEHRCFLVQVSCHAVSHTTLFCGI